MKSYGLDYQDRKSIGIKSLKRAENAIKRNPDWPLNALWKTVIIKQEHFLFWSRFLEHWISTGYDEKQEIKAGEDICGLFEFFLLDIEDLESDMSLFMEYAYRFKPSDYKLVVCYHDAIWLLPALEMYEYLAGWDGNNEDKGIAKYYHSLLRGTINEMKFLDAISVIYMGDRECNIDDARKQ